MSACNEGDPGSIPGLGSYRRKWQPTPVFLPGKSHGLKSRAAHSPGGCKESDTAEKPRTHTTVSMTLFRNNSLCKCNQVKMRALRWVQSCMTGVYKRRGEQTPRQTHQGKTTWSDTCESRGEAERHAHDPSSTEDCWKRREEPSLQISEGAMALLTP